MNSSDILLTIDVLKACNYAAECHVDDKLNDNETPIINHLLETVSFLVENGVTDRDVIIASILHDSLNSETKDKIPKLFGETVLEYVKGCVVDSSLNIVERKQHLLEVASDMSPQVKQIYLGDLHSNVKFMLSHKLKGWSEGMIKGYLYWAMRMCRYLAGINKQMDDKLTELFKKHYRVEKDLSNYAVDNRINEYFVILKDRYNLN